jgi:hypothetical protein
LLRLDLAADDAAGKMKEEHGVVQAPLLENVV